MIAGWFICVFPLELVLDFSGQICYHLGVKDGTLAND